VLEFRMVAPGHVYYTAKVTLDMEHVVWMAREALTRKGKRVSCQGIEVKLKKEKRRGKAGS
jgi:hypothetical protein